MQKDKTVFVAMSGGVDSSVAAALLKKRGFNVIGVFMKPWSPKEINIKSETIENPQQNLNFCMWEQDREDAMRAATAIGIPLKTWDFSREYGRKVTHYMINAYRSGITPNPDIMCNKEIKFGLFFKKAMHEGADFIATGHYARLRREFPISNFPARLRYDEVVAGGQFSNKSKKNKFKTRPTYKLSTAKDKNKDQTYFLWTLTQKQLSRTLFPIGEYTKPQVRKMAKKFGLANYNKKDSQGVCFVGPMDVKSFLKLSIPSRRGKILHRDGRYMGQHDGAAYYTIGQRRGLNITTGGGPYYVISKDIKNNTICVGSEKDLLSYQGKITDVHFINEPAKLPLSVNVKIRYRAQGQPAVLSKNGRLKFSRPQRAVTPGQSAVFYRGQEVIGGGILVD